MMRTFNQVSGPSRARRKYIARPLLRPLATVSPVAKALPPPPPEPVNDNEYSKAFQPWRKDPEETSRVQLYRKYLQHLRLFPDPHLWAMKQPQMREWCSLIKVVQGTAPSSVFLGLKRNAIEEDDVAQEEDSAECTSEWTPERKKAALHANRSVRAFKKARIVSRSNHTCCRDCR